MTISTPAIDRTWKTGWAFSLPGLSTLAIVMGLPLVYAILMSLSSMTLLRRALDIVKAVQGRS